MTTSITTYHFDMTIETLISRLDGVKETGPGRYLSRCPGHDDRSPSLAIKDGDDGRVLIHCFAGCETEDVLSAIGMTFSDVMPERIGQDHSYKPIRNRISPRDALAALDHESLVVAIIGADILTHKKVDESTWSRLAQSVARINETRAMTAPAKVAR